jgi:hypothetical protein
MVRFRHKCQQNHLSQLEDRNLKENLKQPRPINPGQNVCEHRRYMHPII